MSFRLTPRYEDLIGEPREDIDELIGKIPTVAVLTVIALMNARIDANISEGENLKFYFRRIPERFPQIKKRIDHAKHRVKISIFSKLHLCRLAILTLKNPNPEIRDVTPDEHWSIFKIYLILVSQFNESQVASIEQNFNHELGAFNNLTWPTIAEQYQFMNDRENLFDLVKVVSLVDDLLSNGFDEEIKTYSKKIGMPLLNLISNIHGISNHQHTLNIEGIETPSFYVKLNNASKEIFKSLTIDIEKAKSEKDYDANYLAIKKHPLFSYKDDILVIINRQFLRNKIYDGFIFDFYTKSGIAKKYKQFNDFKSYIGKEVAEKRLFKSLIKSIFNKKHQITVFSEKDSHPDCYLRIHNRIFLLEFKDYMMPTRVITSLDVNKFKNEVDKKFIENEKGKPKGISQLANQINYLSNNEYEFDEIYSNGMRKEKLELYPIIVFTDYQYSIPGINNYLVKVFDEKLNSDLGFKETYPPTMVNINYLFQNANYIAQNRLDNIIKTYYKKVRQNEKLLEKKPSPDNWILANLSFDDIGVVLDYKKKSSKNILEKYLKNLELENIPS